jgi:hypothetical protein
MIKTIVSRGTLFLTVLLLFSSAAFAGTFKLRIDTGSKNPSTGEFSWTQGVVISDAGSGDTNGQAGAITWNGAIGSFFVNVSTALSKPALGGPGSGSVGEIHLNSVNIIMITPGALRITMEDNDFEAAPDFPLHMMSDVGGVMTGPAGSTIKFTNGVTLDNTVPDLGTSCTGVAPNFLNPQGPFAGCVSSSLPQITGIPGAEPVVTETFGVGAFAGSSTEQFTTTGPKFGMYTQAIVDFTGAMTMQNISFDSSVKVVTPEPMSLLLLGSGLAGLGFFGRRKRAGNSDTM